MRETSFVSDEQLQRPKSVVSLLCPEEQQLVSFASHRSLIFCDYLQGIGDLSFSVLMCLS
jgi:hypothetical protein